MEEWIELYNNGMSMSEIRRRYNHGGDTVSIFLRKNNVKMRDSKEGRRLYSFQKYPIEDRMEWVRLYGLGVSVKQISNVFLASDTTIWHWLQKNGVTRSMKESFNLSVSLGRRTNVGYSITAQKYYTCSRRGKNHQKKIHRLVFEEYLGRELTKKEVVHHIDFNRTNNKIQNLMLFATSGEHTKHHAKLRKEVNLNKYKNIKTEIDGVEFHSKKEASRYLELKLLQKDSVITSLTLQPQFVLQDKFKKDGKTIGAIKYIADFSYFKDGKRIVEDVKGYYTTVFKLKKKLFEFKYPNLELKLT